MRERVWGQGKGNQYWYDVDEMVEGKGTGSEKDHLGTVEVEGL